MKVRPSFHSSRLNNHLSRRFVSRHLKLLSVLFVLIAAVLVTNVGSLSASKGTSARRATAKQSTPRAERKPGTQSVASVLNDDGSVKPGVNGSFDVSGFRMGYAPNGAPRFVSAPMVADGCASGWDTQFGLNGVEGGTVRALAVMGSDLYVGGDFTKVGNVTANRVAKFNATNGTWSPLGFGDGNGVGRTGSIVYALAVLGSDLYVGGSFMTVNYGGSGGTPEATAYNIAKYDTTASTWSALSNGNGNGVRGKYVTALAVMGSDLYVGGFFTSVNFYGTGGTPEVTANNIAKFNPSTNAWSALGTGNGNGVNNSVWALAVMGSDLYLGGVFTRVNYGGSGATPAFTANYIVKFNTTANTWSVLSTHSSANGMNLYVHALAVIGSDLYIGGYFSTANYSYTHNVQANHIVKFDTVANTWSALGNGNGIGLDNTVYALAVSGSDLYVGGLFTTTNFGGSGGTPEVTANHIAKFDTTTGIWSALGDGLNSSVNALAIGSDLYVSGDFTLAGNVVANRLAKFNLSESTWSAASNGTGNGIAGGTVKALAVMGSDLYVAGDFTNVGDLTANRVARFNSTTGAWSPLGFGNGNGVGKAGSIVYALAVMGSDLYVGGSFTTVNYGGSGGTPEVTANNIAKFDTTTNTWSALSNGNGNGVSGKYVSALAVMGSDLYVGGLFATANYGGTGGTPAVPANNIAKFDRTTNIWSALGDGVNNSVYALAVMGSDLYLGGVFTRMNYGGSGGAPPGSSANYIAKFNTSTNAWSALSNGIGSGNGLNKYVHALAVVGSDLYIGGYFTKANYSFSANVTANYLVKFDTITNTWSALKNGNGNGLDNCVYALAVIGSDLYVGGVFTFANFGGSGGTPAVTANRIAKFNTTTGVWSALGGGLNSNVNALATGSDLYLGGDFTLAGDSIASSHIAQWFIQDPPTLTYSNQNVAVDGSLTINPATGPADDVSVSSIAVQSVGAYTGGISVDNETGAVSISNAVPGGTHSLTIRATDNCGATTDASLLLTVIKRATTTTVSSSVNPSDFGQSVVFTATVTSTAGGMPTGTVQFKVDGVSAGAPVALDASGVATLTTSSLDAGTRAITADYSGDATFNPSTGTLAPAQQINCTTVPMTVTNSNDSGPGSLRDIINNACPGGTITFAPNLVSPITLTTGELLINKSLTITGPGANALAISGNWNHSGILPYSRVFHIQPNNTVSITDLAITNGYPRVFTGGGGVFNEGTLALTNCNVYDNDTVGYGGGVWNQGVLTMTNCNVYGNEASDGYGGGVDNHGTLTMTNCNVYNNGSVRGAAGGINNAGTSNITNSTLSGNSTWGGGGGVYNKGTLTLTNVTLTNNTTSGGSGGGIYQSGGTVSLRNTIVAGNFKGYSPNTTANNIFGTVDAGSSYNLIGPGGSGGLTNGTNHNQVGVSNALLGTLTDNGGPTQTHALLAGSPAIDAGDNCVVLASSSGGCLTSPLTTDQRGGGFARQVNGTVDIGAFEFPLNVANSSSSSKPVAGVPQMFSVNLSNPSPNSDRRRRLLMRAAAAGPCCGSRRTPRSSSGS